MVTAVPEKAKPVSKPTAEQGHQTVFVDQFTNGILDPQRPHQLFKLADLENDRADEHHSRVRIKLGERVT